MGKVSRAILRPVLYTTEIEMTALRCTHVGNILDVRKDTKNTFDGAEKACRVQKRNGVATNLAGAIRTQFNAAS